MSDVEIVEDQEFADGDVQPDVPTKIISSVLGLMGFFTALIVGLYVGNPGMHILLRAMVAMLVCVVVGRLIGTAGEICVREYLTKYKKDRPMPELPEELKKLYKERADDDALRDKMKNAA